jgi:hypothetical protein
MRQIVRLVPIFTTGIVSFQVVFFSLRHDTGGIVPDVEHFGDVVVEASAGEDRAIV